MKSMDHKTVVVQMMTGKTIDIDIPVNISAKCLIAALYEALKLPGDCPDFVRCENPIAMLQGDAPVSYFGIRDGSILYF